MASYTQPGTDKMAGTTPALQVLDVQRAYYAQSQQRRAEHVRILYADGARAGEVRASISWEALAQFRSELHRAGKDVIDDDILGLVLVPWALERLAAPHAPGQPVSEDLHLDFGDAPRPRAANQLLVRYGLL
ncbi:MAG TPA: hypothetical protein VI876_06880 [Dehalococcoidia bacterium]|nr:hypothetical protein [Dehalococcoidia bacterium]